MTMSEHDPIQPDEDVEAHLLKEALAMGAAATTFMVGTGAAHAGTTPNQLLHPTGAQPAQVEPSPGGAGAVKLPDPGGAGAVKLPEPGGTGSVAIPVPDTGSKAVKAKAKAKHKKATVKKHHRAAKHNKR
jgi:hypothetical protein